MCSPNLLYRLPDRLLHLELAEFAAWRIYALVKQGRETPDLPCDVYLAEEEWKVLHAWKKKAPPPDKPPPLREAVRWIASLGGFLGRKGDGDPGTTTTWRGLERLSATVEGWQLYQTMHPARASPCCAVSSVGKSQPDSERGDRTTILRNA